MQVSAPGLADDHPGSYMSMARRLAQQNEGWFDVNQYDNLDNPEGHYRLGCTQYFLLLLQNIFLLGPWAPRSGARLWAG